MATIKRRVLDTLSRKTLHTIADGEEITLSDRRALAPMRETLFRRRSLALETLLDYLSRNELKAACRALGLGDGGRAKAVLRRRILGAGRCGQNAGDGPAGEVSAPAKQRRSRKGRRKASQAGAPAPSPRGSQAAPGDAQRGVEKESASSLNPAQRSAAKTLEGALLVVAGAGTGKTRTLVQRLVALVQAGVQPADIVLLTFTRRAAAEMVQRVEDLLGPGQRGIRGGSDLPREAGRPLRVALSVLGEELLLGLL